MITFFWMVSAEGKTLFLPQGQHDMIMETFVQKMYSSLK